MPWQDSWGRCYLGGFPLSCDAGAQQSRVQRPKAKVETRNLGPTPRGSWELNERNWREVTSGKGTGPINRLGSGRQELDAGSIDGEGRVYFWVSVEGPH